MTQKNHSNKQEMAKVLLPSWCFEGDWPRVYFPFPGAEHLVPRLHHPGPSRHHFIAGTAPLLQETLQNVLGTETRDPIERSVFSLHLQDKIVYVYAVHCKASDSRDGQGIYEIYLTVTPRDIVRSFGHVLPTGVLDQLALLPGQSNSKETTPQ